MTVKDLKDFLEEECDELDDDMEVTAMCCDDGCYWEVPAACEIRKIGGIKTLYIGDEQED